MATARSSSASRTRANGTAVIDAGGGSVTYTPDADATGSDTFGYTIDDGNGATASADVAITIGPASDPPAAADDAATTDEDTAGHDRRRSPTTTTRTAIR